MNIMKEEDQKALIRAEVIMQELRGELMVTEAAAQLGISRKTYYEWQKRALDGLITGLKDKPSGRPKKEVDPEVVKLKNKLNQVQEERDLLKMHLEIKEILEDLSEEDRQSILANKAIKAEIKTRNQRKRNRKKKVNKKPNRTSPK
jgi:transposase